MRLPIYRAGMLVFVVVAAGAGAWAIAEEPKTGFQPVDLQAQANQKLDNDFHTLAGNNLKPLPRGRQTLKNVEFLIGDKFLQLASQQAPDYPEKIEAVAVNRKLTRMHFLHATGWGSPDSVAEGTQIGSFKVRYEDMTSVIVPIEYGHDLRDWWDFDDARPATRAVVAWQGANEASRTFDGNGNVVGIRLYLMIWKNPYPEKTVTGFDYRSNNDTDCAPFLVAATSQYVPTEAPLNRDVPRHRTINERARQRNVDLIFIGDSITEGLETNGSDVWKKRYDARKALNAGIGGDRTQHVLWRIDNGNVDGLSPKLAVLMIGTNNFGDDSADDIAIGVRAIVEKLRAKLPKTKVLLLGVFPRGEKPDDPLRAKNNAVNAIIRDLGDGIMVHYLEINNKLLKGDGEQDRALMPDLVHLSPIGYEIWSEAIESKVAEFLEGKIPFPELPKGAGKIDDDAPQIFTETESGLRYRILRKGTGAVPKATETVTVDYKGWLDGGKAFDASYDRGESTSFPLNGVIKGWTEGLQLVGTGGMIELEIPFDLGYGERGRPPQIPPKATLHFLVELLEVN